MGGQQGGSMGGPGGNMGGGGPGGNMGGGMERGGGGGFGQQPSGAGMGPVGQLSGVGGGGRKGDGGVLNLRILATREEVFYLAHYIIWTPATSLSTW